MFLSFHVVLADPRKDVERRPTLAERWRRIHPWIVAVLLVAGAGNAIHLPYYSVGPGPATDVLDLIAVEGPQTFESDGELLLTTASVSTGALTIFEYLWTFADGSLEAIPERAIVPEGTTDAEQQAKNQLDMETSKLDAEMAAFAALGYEVTRVPGARVLSVQAGSAADGTFEPGDRIYRVDGVRVADAQAVVDALAEAGIGARVTIDVVRDGAPTPIEVTLGSSDSDPPRPQLGVMLNDVFRLPGNVEIDTQRIGGPSGGLVFALSLVELLSQEDLTRGRTIAVTGTIRLENGTAIVGSVGAVGHKVHGAIAAGAELFIVPAEHEAEAMAVAGDELRIVGVSTLSEAIEALRGD